VDPEILVLEDPAAVAVERLATASGHVVLTGGSTPRAAYQRVADERSDWSGVDFWFTDERCVPPDHEHSNYRMAREALLDRGQGSNVHRMEGERGPGDGAAAYERELDGVFGETVPAFELILVGLGPDAHVCSLFPGDDALGERERRVVGVETPGMAPLLPRITITLPVLDAAREVLFLVTGAEKAEAVRRSFSGNPDPRAPGSLVRPDPGKLTVAMDPAAAGQL
jgi:6-phosphogluconolactonase